MPTVNVTPSATGRPYRHPAIPLHIKTSDEISDDIVYSITPSQLWDDQLRFAIALDHVTWHRSTSNPRFVNLVTLSRQAKERLDTDGRFPTGKVLGYYPVPIDTITTPFGHGNLRVKLEVDVDLGRDA